MLIFDPFSDVNFYRVVFFDFIRIVDAQIYSWLFTIQQCISVCDIQDHLNFAFRFVHRILDVDLSDLRNGS